MNGIVSEKLNRARAYEAEKMKKIPQEIRPSFHVTSPVGWINDPNGFSLYNGEYHLFYQYHPYSNHWGPMHWGHSKTKDFVKWEQLPCALAPDTAYDGQGCFSGSAVEHDGKHILMYTSVLEEEQADGSRKVRQTQSIAVGDGINYEKVSCNPVIKADVLPEGSSPVDFRDPKIWKDGDTFYAVIGSLHADGSGQIALFSSGDALQWKFEKILDRCSNEYGKMWECPDFFPLDGQQVLINSPQFMSAKGLEFHNGNNSLYFVGSYDRDKLEFVRGEGRQIDYGLDFYAPQTVEAADGRRIMVAWLASWDNYFTPDAMPWCGMMTIPRELSLRDGRLVQAPVRELEKYRQNAVRYEKVHISGNSGNAAKGGTMTQTAAAGNEAVVTGSMMLDGVNGRCLDMTVEIEAGDYDSFTIALAADKAHQTLLTYEPKKGTFTTDRTWSGLTKDVLTRRSMYAGDGSGKIKVRVLMDRYSVEVFVNDGVQAMTSLIYTPLTAEQIAFSCEGEAVFTIEKYEIVTE